MHAADLCIGVAEDDHILRLCITSLLRKHGYKVVEARDGSEAAELVEKCNDAIHLLISICDMPGMNGAELATLLKQRHDKMLVLLVSGTEHSGAQPFDDFLPKPYHSATLAIKVRDLLRRGETSRPSP